MHERAKDRNIGGVVILWPRFSDLSVSRRSHEPDIERRKREEKEQEKQNPEKRQKQEEEEKKGPTLQYKSPFSL
jgi:hypothetical protein